MLLDRSLLLENVSTTIVHEGDGDVAEDKEE